MRKTGVPEIDDSQASFVLGTDECGYGSWAGRLYVAGAVVPRDWKGPLGLTDSKDLTPKARERISTQFRGISDDKGDHSCLWVIRFAEPEEIDKEGVGVSLRRLHRECITSLLGTVRTLWDCVPLIVVDGNMKIGLPDAISLPKADLLVPAVSIASVIGKVEHDRVMREADKLYPGYDFGTAVGYRTARHEAKLEKDGPCPIHRRSYEPVARVLKKMSETSLDDFMAALEAADE